MAARVPVHNTTLVLGITGLIFALVSLGLYVAFVIKLVSGSYLYGTLIVWIVVEMAICIVAASLTIGAACRNSRALAITAMVFLILGALTAFGQLVNWGQTAIFWSALDLDDDFDNINIEAYLWVLAVCGLGMFVVFIWASANMCRFVSCCGSPAQTTTLVMVPQGAYPHHGAPPAYNGAVPQHSQYPKAQGSKPQGSRAQGSMAQGSKPRGSKDEYRNTRISQYSEVSGKKHKSSHARY